MSDTWYMIFTGLLALAIVVRFYVALIRRHHASSAYDFDVARTARNRLRRQRFEADVQMKIMELQADEQEKDIPPKEVGT